MFSSHTIIIIIMSLMPVSSSYEDIGGVPSMQSCYSAGMKRCGICMEERNNNNAIIRLNLDNLIF